MTRRLLRRICLWPLLLWPVALTFGPADARAMTKPGPLAKCTTSWEAWRLGHTAERFDQLRHAIRHQCGKLKSDEWGLLRRTMEDEFEKAGEDPASSAVDRARIAFFVSYAGSMQSGRMQILNNMEDIPGTRKLRRQGQQNVTWALLALDLVASIDKADDTDAMAELVKESVALVHHHFLYLDDPDQPLGWFEELSAKLTRKELVGQRADVLKFSMSNSLRYMRTQAGWRGEEKLVKAMLATFMKAYNDRDDKVLRDLVHPDSPRRAQLAGADLESRLPAGQWILHRQVVFHISIRKDRATIHTLTTYKDKEDQSGPQERILLTAVKVDGKWLLM